jgi:sirohydrochlorin cobaltochelatase
MPDPKTTGVIILGRGSSDKIANGEVAKLARWLEEEKDHELVDIAFTGITYPRLETVVQRQVKLGMTQIAILPYYLFTGTLITRISEQVKYLQGQYPQIRFGLGHYLGFEAEIYSLLDDNVKALQQPDTKSMMECDGCSYRAFAQEHGHGHHH